MRASATVSLVAVAISDTDIEQGLRIAALTMPLLVGLTQLGLAALKALRPKRTSLRRRRTPPGPLPAGK